MTVVTIQPETQNNERDWGPSRGGEKEWVPGWGSPLKNPST